MTSNTRTSDERRSWFYYINHEVLASCLAIALLTWILAVAGAVFAVRIMMVIGFAALAGRAQRTHVPVKSD